MTKALNLLTHVAMNPYQKLRLVCECDSENRGIIKCFDNVINFNAAIRVKVNNVIRKII